MDCVNEGCPNRTVYGGECRACFYIRQQVEATRNVIDNSIEYQGKSLFFIAGAVEEIEWPDEVDKDWVL